jgi:FlaG protein
MALDPIRPIELAAVSNAAPARATSVRPQPGKPPAPAPRSIRPAPVPVPEPQDVVNVKWDRSDGVIVTFTDKKSGDLVRQIPSEQVLNVARFIRQLLEEEDAGNSAGSATGSGQTL